MSGIARAADRNASPESGRCPSVLAVPPRDPEKLKWPDFVAEFTLLRRICSGGTSLAMDFEGRGPGDA